MIVNAASIEAVGKAYQTLFLEAYRDAQTDYPKVAMEVPSTTSETGYGWLGGFPRMSEWIGDRHIAALEAHDFTIKNKTWANGVEVKREQIEDDTYGTYAPMIQMIGKEAKEHPNELVFSLLKNGASQLCFDGQYFFDTDHPLADGTASNYGGGTGTAWFLLCTNWPIKPLIWQLRRQPEFTALDDLNQETVFKRSVFQYGADYRGNAGYGLWQLAYMSKQELNADNYAAARAAMGSLTNDSGRPLNLTPDLLVVPPSLEGNARALLLSQKNAAGADNPWYQTADLLKTAWLL